MTTIASTDLGGVLVSDIWFHPLVRFRPHEHDRACVGVVLGGGVEKTFPRRSHRLCEKTAFTMPAGERHKDGFSREGARVIFVEPDADTAAELGTRAPLFDRVGSWQDGAGTVIAARIARELAEPDDLTGLAVEALVLELVVAAERRRRGSAGPRCVALGVEFLHEHFAERVQLADVAAAAGVHPAHLARAFRASHGVSIGQYVRRLRCEWAAAKLCSTDEPLAEIARGAGFADQSHFTRAFRGHSGTTPGRYRAALR
jgi:AraC family transcriptional regulator